MAIHLDIDLLRSFVIVAETRVLSRAAEQIGRTQAAVSMQIQRLEAATGRPLLLRTGRGVILTMHGERLLSHARKILRAHDEAVADMSGDRLSGGLRFGCPDDYAAVLLPQLLRSFASQHPRVLIEVICAPTPRLRERLKKHLLDIALVSVRADAPATRIIRLEPLAWVASRGDDASRRDPLPIAVSDPEALDHQAATASLERAGRAYRVAYASGHIAGLLAVVRSGQAIAVLTATAVPPDLEILPTSKLLPSLPSLGITIEKDPHRTSSLVDAFEAHIATVLPSL